jgi:hypothetical protein
MASATGRFAGGRVQSLAKWGRCRAVMVIYDVEAKGAFLTLELFVHLDWLPLLRLCRSINVRSKFSGDTYPNCDIAKLSAIDELNNSW